MKKIDLKSDKVLMILLTIFLIISRLLPHPPNFVPFTAAALFFGKRFGFKNNTLIIIVASIFSDIFLGFHSTIIFVYSAYLFINIFAKIVDRLKLDTGLFNPFFASSIFFVWTNLGVWLYSGMYEKTFSGLINCFFLALPFWKNSLLSDHLFYLVFIGAEALVFRLNQSKNILSPKSI